MGSEAFVTLRCFIPPFFSARVLRTGTIPPDNGAIPFALLGTNDMTTNDEITKRIAALELENAKLKTQLGHQTPTVKQTTTHVATWKGHPVLHFEGNFRPFAVGLKKCSLILERLEDVKFFVESKNEKQV